MQRDLLLDQRVWILRRNCSLTPRQTLCAYALLATLSLSVGLVFAWHGAWMVLCFTALEITAVTWAYLYYSRHALDHERIVLRAGQLLVESVIGTRVARVQLDPARTRVHAPARPHELVTLEARGATVTIGAPLPAWRRAAFAHELESELRGGLFTSGSA